MRFALLTSLLAALLLPGAIASAQTPPVVVIGPPPAASGPPPQATPSVPPGYEVEGDLGGMHFRARVTTPGATQLAPPVAPAPVPQQQIVIAPPPAAPPPVMVMQPQPAPQPQVTYVQAQPQYQLAPQMQADTRPRLDGGMDFGARLAFEVLGAGAGFGIGVGLGYLVNSNARDDGFAVTTLLATAGLVPTGVSLFGGAIAGGRGRYGGALLGELIGGGLSATILLGGGIELHDSWELVAAIAGPAILGAIIGFEAQHGLRTARLEARMERESVQLSGVSVAPISQGGAVVGLSGTF